MDILVTGGCGFIGTNTVRYFAEKGHSIHIIDNLSRDGSEVNLSWLRNRFDFEFTEGDIRNRELVENLIHDINVDVIIHLASQVAVTTSVETPRYDFEVNARGTFNLLDAIRQHTPNTIFLNASTNKVYGSLRGHEVEEQERRYVFASGAQGIDESQPLNFHSPYGCSKGAADQYVEDYYKIYSIPSVNFRQSCIYGPRQFGMESQGWIAWFIIAHLTDQPITIYGNGKQVRDILYVDDLVKCYESAIKEIDDVAGESFNIGGGKTQSVSLLEFIKILEKVSEKSVSFDYDDWRPGDQKVYISDTSKAARMMGWEPNTSVEKGIERLYAWVFKHQNLVSTYEGIE